MGLASAHGCGAKEPVRGSLSVRRGCGGLRTGVGLLRTRGRLLGGLSVVREEILGGGWICFLIGGVELLDLRWGGVGLGV